MEQNDKILVEEYYRRQLIDFTDLNFPKQTAFIKSKAKKKAAKCSRRSGKSYGVGLYLCEVASKSPNVTCLYLALTHESAKRIMFKDVLQVISREKGLELDFRENPLTVKFKNGSVIYLMGLNQSDDQAEKLLGQKYKLVVVDEAASQKRDLRDIIYGKIEPATADLNGTICLIGTTGNVTSGLFYDVTTGQEKGWDIHEWDWRDNPYMKDKIQKQIDQMVLDNPEIVNTPIFKQMYLNEWVIDTDQLCYKISDKNIVSYFKEYDDSWTHVMGVDLGYNDATSFVIAAFNEKVSKKLYYPFADKQSGLDITSVAEKIRYYQERFKVQTVVIDGAAKQAVEEMRSRHGLSLIAAEKTGKSDFIEIMSSEMIQGNIVANETEAECLVDEWHNLVWIKDKRIENPACENHAADAALYAWRFCYNYHFQTPTFKPKVSEQQKVDQWFEKLENKQEKDFWEKDWE